MSVISKGKAIGSANQPNGDVQLAQAGSGINVRDIPGSGTAFQKGLSEVAKGFWSPVNDGWFDDLQDPTNLGPRQITRQNQFGMKMSPEQEAGIFKPQDLYTNPEFR